ncbi:BrnT family toxin [Phaeospirillum tilakii]|uniref:BrnT family toxin n=1 Tax=Phaeospirillum tilakii TaxID=741673 RepID=A0ABW5CCX3_9PROT
MHWTWDRAKAETNKRKHGISFELAEHGLGDPLAVTFPDPWPDEERWRTLCMPATGPAVVLFVVHTWPDNPAVPGRIISAREASPAERRAYEEG